MTKLFAIAVLLCGMGWPVYGGDGDDHTQGRFNGRFWMGIDDVTATSPCLDNRGAEPSVCEQLWRIARADFRGLVKGALLLGMKEGIESVGAPNPATHIVYGLSALETSKALDEFYKTPENLPMPIAWALRVIAFRINGGAPDAVEKQIALFRMVAAAASTPTPGTQSPNAPQDIFDTAEKQQHPKAK